MANGMPVWHDLSSFFSATSQMNGSLLDGGLRLGHFASESGPGTIGIVFSDPENPPVGLILGRIRRGERD